MRCFYPIDAWQLDSGEIVFHERGKIRRYLNLRCGRCIGCRLARSCEWAVRVMHEAQMHSANSFVTLTLDDEHLTTSLNYDDFRLFMRRLRKVFPKARFFMCGEYGENFQRPHYHAVLFGVDFVDREPWKRLPSGFTVFRSKTLERLWPFGFSSVGDVSFESAAYVARYCVKKVTGPLAESVNEAGLRHYDRFDVFTGEVTQVVPEFMRCSLKPGIGASWIEKYKTDVFPSDDVVIDGRKVTVPKFYDKYLKSNFGLEYDWLEFERYNKAQLYSGDSTPDRLAVLEVCTKARLKFKSRTLE